MIALPLPLRLKLGAPLGGVGCFVSTVRPAAITVERNGDGTWTYTFPVGRSPYTVWFNGRAVGTTDTESYTFTLPGYESEAPALEFVSAGATADSQRYPPRVRLRWRGLVAATCYAVEQYVSGSWVQRCVVNESARGEYEFLSQPQTDAAATQWRVSAVDLAGNQGTAISFTFTIVRNPAPPSVAFSISAGNVVVSAG